MSSEFAVGEASAPYLGDLGYDHEAVGIDLTGKLLDLGQLVVGDNAENQFCFLPAVAAFAVEHGHTPGYLVQDGLTDFLVLFADDLDLRPAGTQEHDLVQGDGDDDDDDGDGGEEYKPLFS